MTDNLTNKQKDYAVFLPAISSFYATFIGKQAVALQTGEELYVPEERIPVGLGTVEALNFLNEDEGVFTYKWGLYSAGHASFKDVPKENMIQHRHDRPGDTVLLADSGGFQIAKGVWSGDWRDPTKHKTSKAGLSFADAENYRKGTLEWLCNISDYSMCLDIPTWITSNPEAGDKVGIHTVQEAVEATKYNNEYFIKHRTGESKFLNVLQGNTLTSANNWYEEMKQYCDPKQYDNHFNGWGMGGVNMARADVALKRIVRLIHDGLLEEGVQDWMHFLGTSKLEWAVFLTDVQRAVRRTHNKNFTISFDCASPFLATANGQVYHETIIEDLGQWSYSMDPTADDKKYATDTRKYSEGVIADGIHDVFQDSPLSEHLQMKDICCYAPNQLNKIGKVSKTSWDSFSYALLMGHNVWQHINAVQEANRQYDKGVKPKMFVAHDGKTVTEIVNIIFDELDYNKQLELIDHYYALWKHFPGARGLSGKKAMSAEDQFTDLFGEVGQIVSSKTLKEKKPPATITNHLFEED